MGQPSCLLLHPSPAYSLHLQELQELQQHLQQQHLQQQHLQQQHLQQQGSGGLGEQQPL